MEKRAKDKMKLKDIKLTIGMFIFSCLTLINFIIKHFSHDTFIITKYGYQGYAIKYSFLDGRVFMGCISLIADKLKIPIFTYNSILLIIAILISTIAIVKLKNIVLKYKKIEDKKCKVLLIIACYYTIFHFFYLENLYFAESIVMALSILFYIIAADLIVDNNRYFKSFMFLLLGVLSYQATISMFFISVILFSTLKDASYKEIIKNFVKSIVIALIVIAINYVEILIAQNITGFKQGRISKNIFINIAWCTFNIWNIISHTLDKFPRYLFLAFIVIIELLIQYNTFKYSKNKNGEKFLIEQIFLITLSITLSFIPSFLSATAFFSARIRFSIGATIGILFIHIIAKSNIISSKRIVSRIMIGVLIMYAIINSANYIYLTMLNQKSNELDIEYVNEVDKYISEYEKENNIEVKKIALIVETSNTKKYHKEIKLNNSFTIITLRTEWAVDGFINYYTGRNLEKIDTTAEMKELYAKNVDKEKDYMCIGDTFYITIYHN